MSILKAEGFRWGSSFLTSPLGPTDNPAPVQTFHTFIINNVKLLYIRRLRSDTYLSCDNQNT